VNVVDSSGWLEYFADGPNAAFFAPVIHDFPKLIVPTISVFEVFKKMRLERGEEAALEAVAQMQRGKLILLDAPLAVASAETSLIQKLPMADAIMLSTARANNAILWTQDDDFEGLDGVKYIAKKKTAK
jgi:predicted nucleic acid-binding protein